MCESGCPKHAIVRRQLDQLLTWAAGNGVFVQNSMKAIKMIINMLINVTFSFVRLSVVKKEFVLNILSACLYTLLFSIQIPFAVLCFDLWLVSFCRIFYIFKIRQCFRQKLKTACASWFLKMFRVKHFLF